MLKRYCNKISQCLHSQIIEENHHNSPRGNDENDGNDVNDIFITIKEPIDNVQDSRSNIPQIDWYLSKQPECYYRENKLYQKFYLMDTFYINDFGRKRILFKNYQDRSKFPIKGWFQECLNCYTPTGQHFMLEGVVPDNIYVHICDKCYCKLEHYRKYKSADYTNFISELNHILKDLDSGSRYISY